MTDATTPRRTCGTMEAHQRMVDTDPVYRQNRLAIELYTRAAALTARAAARATIIRIPVAVHVVYSRTEENISDAQIASQIAALNLDFRNLNANAATVPPPFKPHAADARLEFQLAAQDPTGSPTTGITRTSTEKTVFRMEAEDIKSHLTGGRDPWPPSDYLNLWVAPRIIDAREADLLGYAQLPGGPAATDGVVIWHAAFGTLGTAQPPFHLGRTATHEIGHWLNLLHIWGEDTGGCNSSDEVDDTPNQGGPNYNSPSFPHPSCSNGPDGDMFMNYMDYVDDAVMALFTRGQSARMDACLTGARSSILTSPGLSPTVATRPIAPTLLAEAVIGAAEGTAEAGGRRTSRFNGIRWVRNQIEG